MTTHQSLCPSSCNRDCWRFYFSPFTFSGRLLLGINRKRRGLSWLVRRLLLLFGSAFSRGRGTFLGTQSGNPFSVSRFPALSLVRS